MPSKKRKYNARFPAGRIKKIMQTDEEVGKVAQAVPIIISRTLELFVESLLSKAMQVTMQRNAKTLSPSHVKQCILAESRFDFLRDLVKNIPDVTAAEEREMMSGESSPNSSRSMELSATLLHFFRNMQLISRCFLNRRARGVRVLSTGPPQLFCHLYKLPRDVKKNTSAPRRVVREDSNSSSSSDIRVQQILTAPKDNLRRALSVDVEIKPRNETITSDAAIDLTKKVEEKPVVTANFYQETLLTDEVQHKSVIKVNPTYSSPQPSTSSYASLTPVEPVQRVEVLVPKPEHPKMFYVDEKQNHTPPRTPVGGPRTPVTPILNIDFSKNLAKPEIKVLDTAVANIVGVPKTDKKLQRQNSKSNKSEIKKAETKLPIVPINVDIDHLNSGNLQIDEDYDT